MASIVGKNLDMAGLHKHISAQLPEYAQPLFLRVQPEMEITGTFKHRKVDLVKEGFDPEKIADPLYFDHPVIGKYVRLTAELYEQIVGGKLRV